MKKCSKSDKKGHVIFLMCLTTHESTEVLIDPSFRGQCLLTFIHCRIMKGLLSCSSREHFLAGDPSHGHFFLFPNASQILNKRVGHIGSSSSSITDSDGKVWFKVQSRRESCEPGSNQFKPEPNLSYLGLISTKNQITRVLILVQLFTDLKFQHYW